MNGEKTYQGFIEFIKAQPSHRPVIHTEGWNSCMVGDYVQSDNYMDAYNFAESKILINSASLYKALNTMGKVFPQETTYGETLEYLESKGLV